MQYQINVKSIDFLTNGPYPSPIQTFTVGFGISPNPPFSLLKPGHGLRGNTKYYLITAGWEFHPAPKDSY